MIKIIKIDDLKFKENTYALDAFNENASNAASQVVNRFIFDLTNEVMKEYIDFENNFESKTFDERIAVRDVVVQICCDEAFNCGYTDVDDFNSEDFKIDERYIYATFTAVHSTIFFQNFVACNAE